MNIYLTHWLLKTADNTNLFIIIYKVKKAL